MRFVCKLWGAMLGQINVSLPYKLNYMKKIVLLIAILGVVSCNSQQKRSIKGETEFQREMNAQFKDASTSPLTRRGLKKFDGLAFFPVDSTYRVKATLAKAPTERIIEVPTTTERVAVYQVYGTLTFKIKNQECQLLIYKNKYPQEAYKEHLFLPFLDKTNGVSSYKGGRFIDVMTTDIQKDGTVIIDFNKAYNPYCAYSNRYSCPITPSENALDLAVEAGVMAYKK